MTKPIIKNQGAFSFLDEVEKAKLLPKPKGHTLKPPTQIEVKEELKEEPLADTENILLEENLENSNFKQKETDKIESDKLISDSMGDDIMNPKEGIPYIEARTNTNNIEEEKKTGTRGRRSVKENSIAANSMETPDDETLFQKHYYSMGEVTAMFKENHSLIRYWESEFDILKPKKNGKGDRFFRPGDVKNLFLIYDLLRRRKFTIEGAKEYLKNNKNADEKFAAMQSLQKIKTFFLELKASL